MKVFVAGPYTGGDVAVNVKNAVDAATLLLAGGYTPFVPHLFHFWHLLSPQPYATWTKMDFEWLAECEALVRIPGDSPGAEAEMVRAVGLGIPVYLGVEAFLSARLRRCSVCSEPGVPATGAQLCIPCLRDFHS
jgi:hypothetical protein